jgi:S1-C subfamily serine protease
MRSIIRLTFFLVFVSTIMTAVAPAQVTVKVRAALYDRDLNVKPVPHLTIKLTPLDSPSAPPIVLKTSLDGLTEEQIPSGKYHLVTEKPVELFDKSHTWDFEVALTKPINTIELSNDNARITPLAGDRAVKVDELAAQYKRVKEGEVSVWTDHGIMQGLIVDKSGLVLTEEKGFEQTAWFSVQLDEQHRVAAVVAASDKNQDFAVLRINPAETGPLFVPQLSTDPGALVEGERVFSVATSLKEKQLVTGVVSKVDANSIISDVKPAMGSPLFSSTGNVVGITLLAENLKSYRTLPIASAAAIIDTARKNTSVAAPSPRLLPMLPTDFFPSDRLRASGRDHLEKEIYKFKTDLFEVELLTPVARYEAAVERYAEAVKEQARHKGQAPPTEPEYKYEPALIISAVSQIKKGWGGFHFKGGFAKMRLLCGDKEVDPFWPSRKTQKIAGLGTTFHGWYWYTADAVSPKCNSVSIEFYTLEDPDKPQVKLLDPSVVTRIWQDFEPYRAAKSAGGQE